MTQTKWKIWIQKESIGHVIVWDRAGDVERFGPFKSELEAQRRIDNFIAALDAENVRNYELTPDDLPEWAKPQ
jgi:hypothetical protein